MPAIERNALHAAAPPIEQIDAEQQSAVVDGAEKQIGGVGGANALEDLLGLGDIFGGASTTTNQMEITTGNVPKQQQSKGFILNFLIK